jgi:hypothetical protein
VVEAGDLSIGSTSRENIANQRAARPKVAGRCATFSILQAPRPADGRTLSFKFRVDLPANHPGAGLAEAPGMTCH